MLVQTLKPQKLPYSEQNVNQMILSPKRQPSNDKENVQLNPVGHEAARKRVVLSPRSSETEMIKLSKISEDVKKVNSVSILCNTLGDVVENKYKPSAEDLKEDKNLQRFVLVRNWEFFEKYGYAYQLNQKCFAVNFNDSTTLLITGDKMAEYIEKTYERKVLRFNIQEFPAHIHKKVSLASYFRKSLMGKTKWSGKFTARANLTHEDGTHVRLRKFLRTNHATFFRLSDGSLQVDFEDGSGIALTQRGSTGIFKNKEQDEIIFSFLTLHKSQFCKNITSRLIYIHGVLQKIQKESDSPERN